MSLLGLSSASSEVLDLKVTIFCLVQNYLDRLSHATSLHSLEWPDRIY